MTAFADRIRREFRLAGMKLNAIAALVAGAIIANASQFQAAVTSLVPVKYQATAGLVAGTITYLIVRAVANHDAKKLGNG